MSKKLTPERLAVIKRHLAPDTNPIFEVKSAAGELEAEARDLLAELDRITPEWVPVSENTYLLGRAYEVACTSPTSPTPVWMGRGKYVERLNDWVDLNTGLPFDVGVKVTHYLRSLSPTELIGQPAL